MSLESWTYCSSPRRSCNEGPVFLLLRFLLPISIHRLDSPSSPYSSQHPSRLSALPSYWWKRSGLATEGSLMSKYRVSIKLATIDALYNPSVNPTVFTVSVDSRKFSISDKQYIVKQENSNNYFYIYFSLVSKQLISIVTILCYNYFILSELYIKMYNFLYVTYEITVYLLSYWFYLSRFLFPQVTSMRLNNIT